VRAQYRDQVATLITGPMLASAVAGFGGDPVPAVADDQMVVVDVQADTAFDRGRWRHPTRYLRHRPDLRVRDLTRLPDQPRNPEGLGLLEATLARGCGSVLSRRR
jgi:hypothetical protein